MSYAILGSGAIGSAIASHFGKQGVRVFLANSRGPASLLDLVEKLGKSVSAASVEDALAADVVIVAVPFGAVPDAVGSITDWKGRIVVDTTNAIDFPAFTPTDLGGRLSSEVVADVVRGARVVKAFNTLPAALLAADPLQHGGRRALFLSGNQPAANAEVAGLIERLGFAAIDLGKLSEGGRLQQFAGPLTARDLVQHQLPG